MAYPRENLAAGETVVVHYHPHWQSVVAPILAFLLVTAIAGLAIGAIWGIGSLHDVRPWLAGTIGALWLCAAIWWLVRPLLNWVTTHFVVTDRRVIHRRGLLTRSGIDIPIARINTVEFQHGLIDRLLRTGSLQIQSASDDPLTFVNIPRVESVHALLYRQVLEAHPDDEWGR